MKIDPEKLNGLTLIYKTLEFTRMVPNYSDWNFEKLEDNPPGFIRLKQIDVLMQIFLPEIYIPNDLKVSIENLISGEFILSRSEDIYKDLFIEMDKLILKTKPHLKKYENWSNDFLKYNFETFPRRSDSIHQNRQGIKTS